MSADNKSRNKQNMDDGPGGASNTFALLLAVTISLVAFAVVVV